MAAKHLREFDGLVVDHARRPDPYSITEKDDTDSGRYIIKKVWDMPCEAIAVIKSLQPYQRGNAFRDHPLWHLNELSNIDKHRTPGGRAHDGGCYMDPPPNVWLRSEFDIGVEFSLPLALKNTGTFEPKVPLLTVGDPIDSTSGRVPIELTREQVAEIYRYVREDVSLLFTRFFP